MWIVDDCLLALLFLLQWRIVRNEAIFIFSLCQGTNPTIRVSFSGTDYFPEAGSSDNTIGKMRVWMHIFLEAVLASVLVL